MIFFALGQKYGNAAFCPECRPTVASTCPRRILVVVNARDGTEGFQRFCHRWLWRGDWPIRGSDKLGSVGDHRVLPVSTSHIDLRRRSLRIFGCRHSRSSKCNRIRSCCAGVLARVPRSADGNWRVSEKTQWDFDKSWIVIRCRHHPEAKLSRNPNSWKVSCSGDSPISSR